MATGRGEPGTRRRYRRCGPVGTPAVRVARAVGTNRTTGCWRLERAVLPIPTGGRRAATRRASMRTTNAGASRTLVGGSDVHLNELVRTGEAGVARLVFLDDTNLGVGPRSEVRLDRFVYNPDRSAGSVVVRTGRGVFRFATGVQQPQNYVIQTPI